MDRQSQKLERMLEDLQHNQTDNVERVARALDARQDKTEGALLRYCMNEFSGIFKEIAQLKEDVHNVHLEIVQLRNGH